MPSWKVNNRYIKQQGKFCNDSSMARFLDCGIVQLGRRCSDFGIVSVSTVFEGRIPVKRENSHNIFLNKHWNLKRKITHKSFMPIWKKDVDHSHRVLKEFNGCIQVSEINTVWSLILILLCNENIRPLLWVGDFYTPKIQLGKV